MARLHKQARFVPKSDLIRYKRENSDTNINRQPEKYSKDNHLTAKWEEIPAGNYSLRIRELWEFLFVLNLAFSFLLLLLIVSTAWKLCESTFKGKLCGNDSMRKRTVAFQDKEPLRVRTFILVNDRQWRTPVNQCLRTLSLPVAVGVHLQSNRSSVYRINNITNMLS